MRKSKPFLFERVAVKRPLLTHNHFMINKLNSLKRRFFLNSIYSYPILQNLFKNFGERNLVVFLYKYILQKRTNTFVYHPMNKSLVHCNYNLGVTFNLIKDNDTEIKYVRCKNGK